jgi:hypothetical protein
MRLFGVDLTNEPPKEQSRPSSPEQRASRDFVRPQGESSISHGGQSPIRDFTRHFAQTPYYYQGQGEASRQQDTPSRVIRPVAQRWSQTVESPPWWQALYSQEAQHQTAQPEQPLPNEASSSHQQPQGDLHPHACIDNIQQALQFSMNELERLRSSVPPNTEHMVQQPEESLLSHDEMATVSASDSQSEPSLSSSHKRKRDEASSSRALDSTIYGDDLAPQQPAQSDQAGHEQHGVTMADKPLNKRERNYKKEYKEYKERLAAKGTTPEKKQYARDKDRLAAKGTTPRKEKHARDKVRLAAQGTTP